MYPTKIPSFIQRVFPKYTFSLPTIDKVLYLTFDDGPIPEITPWVLEILANYSAKATFFMIGENVVRHPAIFQQVLNAGHAIGNHTFRHLNGWKTRNTLYFEDVYNCSALFKSKLFRPPYGKLKQSQAKHLRKDYDIILWDVLSGDFDKYISDEQCLNNVLRQAKNGSIIVFHDSLKAEQHLRYVLPKVLAYYHQKGFVFRAIERGNTETEVEFL